MAENPPAAPASTVSVPSVALAKPSTSSALCHWAKAGSARSGPMAQVPVSATSSMTITRSVGAA